MSVTRQRRLMLLVTLLAAVLPLLQACVRPAPVAPEESPGLRSRPRVSIPDLEKRIHILINKERKKHGLPALGWDDRLAAIARAHSRDMAARNYFSHDSPEGRDFSKRYEQAGYSCAVRAGDRIYLGAENIFQNNLYDRVVIRDGRKSFDWNSPEKIARSTVRGWMNSPGHRKNILTPHLRREGIGAALSPGGKVYITQDFC